MSHYKFQWTNLSIYSQNITNWGSHPSISEFRFIKSSTTQSAFRHIPETMSHSRKFTELKHGTVMTCLATKSALLQGIRSITTKWNCLGFTATQPQNVRLHQVTAHRQELRHILCHQHSENSITAALQTSGINISTETAHWELQWNGLLWLSSSSTSHVNKLCF